MLDEGRDDLRWRGSRMLICYPSITVPIHRHSEILQTNIGIHSCTIHNEPSAAAVSSIVMALLRLNRSVTPPCALRGD